jgi:probable HAF family extracellular repeat protein
MKTKTFRFLMVFIFSAMIFAGCDKSSSNSDQQSAPQPYAQLIDLLPGAKESGMNRSNAISGNGRVVVGLSDSANDKREAFRWSRDDGLTALGFLDGYTGFSSAQAVDYDGDTVVGYCSTEDGSANRAFIWTPSTGMQPLGDLPEGYNSQFASGISADGSIVVGYVVGDGTNNVYAFLWTSKSGISYLQTPSRAYAISADGRTIVGSAFVALLNEFQAFRWSAGTEIVFLGYKYESNPKSEAYAVSSDGNVIIGVTGDNISIDFNPMIWTWETGLVDILPYFTLTLKVVSGDGLIAGGGGIMGDQAFLFHRHYGFEPLGNILAYYELFDSIDNRDPITVTGISADGNTITGTAGGNISTGRAFIAYMPLQDFFANKPF